MNDKPKLGLYAGSFSPFHVGHLDIVKQALEVFDVVLVAKGVNTTKAPLEYPYTLPEDYLRELSPRIMFTSFDSMLVDIVKSWERTHNVTVVRGLRNGNDLDYEQNFVAFLREMSPQIKVVAFYCDPKYRHVSSSALRGLEKFSDDEYRKYVIA